MSNSHTDGTEGYSAEADALVGQYESFSFADVHRHILHLIPHSPARILDIGAGTGHDAAGLAEMGHIVTAVEPTAAMRLHGIRLHPSPQIEWLDDSLPDLSVVSARGETFAVVLLTSVWMHLDAAQRSRAMSRIGALVQPGGVMSLTLRHGPVPAGRRMFDVTPAETITLAEAEGLICVLKLEGGEGLLGKPGVTWDRLAFKRQIGD